MIKAYRSLLLAVIATLLSGCANSDRETASGKVDLRAINAIVGAPTANFFIEERNLGEVTFKSSIPTQRFDDLSYNFRFQVSVPGEAGPRVLATQFVDVVLDRDYVFVLDGTIQNPEIRLWDTEERLWDGSESAFELGFAHLDDALGPVDLYFAGSGTAPAAGNEIATLENGDRIDASEFPEGDYELILTPPGDPQTVLYRSGARTYPPATTDLAIIFDKDPSVTGNVNLRHISGSGTSTEMPDPRFPPQARFMHAAFGTGNVDIAEDGDFSPPLVADLAFGERTPDTDLASGATDYSWTAAGNMGAILLDDEQTNGAGLHFNRLLVGPAGDLAVLNSASSRRPFATNPRLSITHAASNFDSLDVYLLPAGDTVADSSATSANVAFPFASGMTSVASDDYELSVTVAGEKAVVAGPVPLDLAAGDVVEAVILDTADPNVAELRIYTLAP